MKRYLEACVFAVVLSVGLGAYAEDRSASGTIEGEIVKISEDTMVVKKKDGKEIVLPVTKITQKDGPFKVGDKVEAFVTPEGVVTSVQPLRGGLRR
ncbi:MAG: hypothetical protein C4293_01860 [Nitrospiraceae bacterium]